MNDIQTLLKVAASRMNVSAFLARLHWVALLAAAVALVLAVVDRLPAVSFVPWSWVIPALAFATVLIALLWWSRNRPSQQHVAVTVDDRLQLREKISTALCVHGRDDAFAQAAIDDAVSAARDSRSQELVRRRFKVEAPRGWWITPLLMLCAIMASFMPSMNLFERDAAQKSDVQQARLESQQAVEAIVKSIQESPQLEKELTELLGDLSNEGTDPNAPLKKPEDFRRDALKKATDINKKLEELIQGEKGKTAEALEQALNQLQAPQDGDAKELADALAKGDFQKAQQALQNLMAKAERGELSDADKQKAAEALENIAQQLEELAQQQQQLEQALKQAGLDPNLANNPQALQQAMQNAQNLNQQQKQELMQMAQAQQAAAQMCQGLAGACQNMAAGLNGQAGKMAQGGQQAGQQLSEMEALQQLLQQAKAAQGQCKGQCQGLGQGLAMSSGNGGAFGGRGQGRGGKAPIAPTPTGTKETKAEVNTVEGDIIARQLFEGQQVRGESRAKLVQVLEQAREGFDEGQIDEQLHRKYQEAHQHYFGELEKLTKALQDEAAESDAPATESDASDSEAESDS